MVEWHASFSRWRPVRSDPHFWRDGERIGGAAGPCSAAAGTGTPLGRTRVGRVVWPTPSLRFPTAGLKRYPCGTSRCCESVAGRLRVNCQLKSDWLFQWREALQVKSSEGVDCRLQGVKCGCERVVCATSVVYSEEFVLAVIYFLSFFLQTGKIFLKIWYYDI